MNHKRILGHIFAVAAAGFIALFPPVVFSQDWPAKPVRVVIPFAAGSVSEAIFRTMAPGVESDLGQRFIVESKPGADGAIGTNEVVRVILRDTLQEITNFGDGGRQPGQFYGVHSIATDSKGNVYTTETYRGQRLQKFVYKGLAPVAKPNQGTVWPTKTATR